MSTAVVIPNWNGIRYLPECLEALLKQISPSQVIVVDNGSTDGSAGLVEQRFPKVGLIALDRNHGFAGGVNRGITAALERGAEYIVLLNNDAVVGPRWLGELTAAMEHGDIAASKILYYDDHTRLDSAGEFLSKWGLFYPSGRGPAPATDPVGYPDIFAASGGASMFRAEVFKHIGLFDEAFFAYLEDDDLSFRARLSGYRVVFAPKAEVYHHVGGTSSKMGQFTRYQFIRNSWYVFIKNVPNPLLFKMLPRFLLMQALLFGAAVANGAGFTAIRAYFGVLAHFFHLLRQRATIQRSRTTGSNEIEALLTDHWPLKRRPRIIKKSAT